MRLGSLFSGILGMDQGLESAGFETVWTSEVEPYPCALITHHLPNVPNLGDITKINWQDAPHVDAICAGFPCQPFSVAGKRKSSSDKRNLWPSTRDAVAWMQPAYFLGENTPGLLSAPASFPTARPKPQADRYFGIILRNLCELGYSVEWAVVSAADVGAPHKRERVFIVAHRAPGPPPKVAPFAVLEREFWVVPATGLMVWLDNRTTAERKYRQNWPKFGCMVDSKAYQLPPLEKETLGERSEALGNPDSERVNRAGSVTGEAGRRKPADAGQYTRIFQPIPRSAAWESWQLVNALCGEPNGLPAGVDGDTGLVAPWGTPRATDYKGAGPAGSKSADHLDQRGYLTGQVANWPTPNASDGAKGGPNQRHGSGDQPLPGAAANWPTPRANDPEKRGNIANDPRNGLPAAAIHPQPARLIPPGIPLLETGRKGRVAKLKALGNACTPQQAAYVGACILKHAEGKQQ